MCGHGMRTNSFFRPHWDFFSPARCSSHVCLAYMAGIRQSHTYTCFTLVTVQTAVCCALGILVFLYVPLENLPRRSIVMLRVSPEPGSRDLLTLLTLTCLVSYTGRCQLIRDPRSRGIRDLSANRLIGSSIPERCAKSIADLFIKENVTRYQGRIDVIYIL